MPRLLRRHRRFSALPKYGIGSAALSMLAAMAAAVPATATSVAPAAVAEPALSSVR